MQIRKNFFRAALLFIVIFSTSVLTAPPVKAAAVAAVQHVNVSGNVTTPSTANTLSVGITPTTTSDLLVAGISLKNAAATTPTISGWVMKTSQCASTNTACSYVFTKVAGTGGVLDTVTTSNLNPTSGVYSGIMTVFEYSNATNSSISFSSNSGTTGQPNAGPLTPTVSSTLIFGIAAQELGTAYTGTTTGTVGTWIKEFSDKNTGAAGIYNLNIGYFDILSGTSGTGYALYPTATSTTVPWSVIIFNFDSQVSQTTAPTVTSPIGSGATTVSGTSTEATGTVIQVYADGIATGTTTTVTSNAWSKTGLTALTAGQAITATATASGKSVSSSSNTVTVSSAPTLSSVSIASNNTTNTLAKAGDTVTLSFTASEAISSPTVAFTSGGVSVTNSVTVTNTSGNNWTATYVVSASDTNGAVAYSISSYHSIANNGNGATVTSGSGSVTVDRSAPSAPGTPDMTSGTDSGSSSSDNITSNTTPAFTISCESGATVSLKEGVTVLGTGTCSSSTVTITSSTLSETTHTIKASQTDPAGNTSSDSSTLSITIDATAPSTTGTPDMTAGTDTGSSSSDNITLNTTPSFTISCESGDTVTLKEGGVTLGTGTCSSSTVTITSSALSETAHTIKATQSDPAGNTSGDSSTLSVTIDASSPSAPGTPDMTSGTDSGSSSSDNITSNTAPAFTISCESGATVSLKEGVTVLGIGTCSGSSVTITSSTLSETTHTIKAMQTDPAGNDSSDSSTLSVTIDATNPSAPGTPDLTAGSDTGSSSTDNVTSSTTPSFTISCESGSTVTLKEGVTTLGTDTCSGSSVTIASSELSEASHTIKALQTDAAGNSSSDSSTLSITIDLSPPSVTGTPDLTSGTDTGSSSSDNVTANTMPALTISCETGSTVTLKEDGTTLGTGTCSGGTVTITSSGLLDGTHTLYAVQTDSAGNVSDSSSTISVTIDTANPSAPGAPDLSSDSDTGSSSTDNITSNTTPTFTFSCESGATVTLKEGSTTLGTGTCADGTVSITTSELTPGSHTLKAIQTDPSGNVSDDSSTLTITIDTTNPSAPGTPDLTSASDSGSSSSDNLTSDTTPSFTLSCESGATVSLKEGGVVLGTGTCSSGTVTVTSSALEDGSHTIKAMQTDPAGNDSVDSSTLSVTIDATAPDAPVITTIGGSDNEINIAEKGAVHIVGTAEVGSAIAVSLSDVGSVHTVSGSGTATAGAYDITLNAISLNDGTVTASVTATDAAGNVSVAATTPTAIKDTVRPTAAMTYSSGHIKSGDSLTITGTFSEDMAEAPLIRIAISGAETVGPVEMTRVSATVYTYTHTLGPDAGTATISLSGGTDLAGNTVSSTPVSGASFVIDNRSPIPTVNAPVFAGSASVSGTTAGDDDATIIEVFLTRGLSTSSLGTTTNITDGVWTLSGLSATTLQADDVITAKAEIDNDHSGTVGDEGDAYSTASSSVTVIHAVSPVPAIDIGIFPGSTTITGTGFYTTIGTQIDVYCERGEGGCVSADPIATATVSADGTWTSTMIILGTLQVGDVFTARATIDTDGSGTINGFDDPSGESSAVIVINPTSPVPSINQLTAQADSAITGFSTGPEGTVIEVFVNGVSLGTTTVDSEGGWSLALDEGDITDGDVITAQATIDTNGDGVIIIDSMDSHHDAPSSLSTEVVVGAVTFVTNAPVLDEPIVAGDTSISGLSSETGSTVFSVYVCDRSGTCFDGFDVLLGTTDAVTTTGPWSAWSLDINGDSFTSASLQTGDIIYATAQTGSEMVSAPSSQLTVISKISPTPTVTAPEAAATSISGTVDAPAGTLVSVEVTRGMGSIFTLTTTVTGGDGHWTLGVNGDDFTSATLQTGDFVQARAMIDNNNDGEVDGEGDSFSSLSSTVTVYSRVSPIPDILGPITAGDSTISGTSSGPDGTVIDVFDGVTFLGQAFVEDGSWTLDDIGLSTLSVDDVITAQARIDTNNDGSNDTDDAFSAASATITVRAVPTKDILSFSFPDADGVISGTDISVTVAYGTDVTNLTPIISHNGVSISPSSGVAHDFSDPVTYTVHANDASTKDYIVTVTVALNPAKAFTSFTIFDAGAVTEESHAIAVTVPYATDVSALAPVFGITGSYVTVDDLMQVSGATTQDFSEPVTYTVHAADGTTQDYVVTVTVALNPAKALTDFAFLSPSATGTIDEDGHTVAITVPYGTNLTALVPTFTITGDHVTVDGSTQTSGEGAQNFTSPVTYRVVAADGTHQDYVVTVTSALNPAKVLSIFTILGDGTVTEDSHTVAVTVPYATDLTSLVASFTTTGASVKIGSTTQVSATTANDFTNPVTYTVHAADGTTQNYVVTVMAALNPAKALTSFSFAAPEATGVVNEGSHTVAITVAYGTDVTGLVPEFVITGASVSVGDEIQTNGETAQDFSSPVTYRVIAADGSHQDYVVTVTVALNSAKAFTSFTILDNGTVTEGSHTVAVTVPYATSVTALVPTFAITGDHVTVGGSTQTSGESAQNFISPVTYRVVAADGTHQDYVVTVTVTLDSAKAITSFTTSTSTGTIISEESHTVTITVPYGTDVSALTPTISITGASISPASHVAQDFSSPVTYTVHAADTTTQDYEVTVNVSPSTAKAITAFTILGDGIVDETHHTITVHVPSGTDVTVLVPAISITGVSVSPDSGVSRDFTSPVTYTVMAADDSTQPYVVSVTVDAPAGHHSHSGGGSSYIPPTPEPETPPVNENTGDTTASTSTLEPVYDTYYGHWAAPSSHAMGPSPYQTRMEEIGSVGVGWYIRGEHYDTVYYVSADMKRHPFWDAQTYFTWADSWDQVVWVTDATLPTLPLGKPMLPKAGITLVKIQSTPNTYAVTNDDGVPTLHLIPNEAMATAVFGEDWADYVIDLAPTVFSNFSKGEPLTVGDVFDKSIMRKRERLH